MLSLALASWIFRTSFSTNSSALKQKKKFKVCWEKHYICSLTWEEWECQCSRCAGVFSARGFWRLFRIESCFRSSCNPGLDRFSGCWSALEHLPGRNGIAHSSARRLWKFQSYNSYSRFQVIYDKTTYLLSSCHPSMNPASRTSFCLSITREFLKFWVTSRMSNSSAVEQSLKPTVPQVAVVENERVLDTNTPCRRAVQIQIRVLWI